MICSKLLLFLVLFVGTAVPPSDIVTTQPVSTQPTSQPTTMPVQAKFTVKGPMRLGDDRFSNPPKLPAIDAEDLADSLEASPRQKATMNYLFDEYEEAKTNTPRYQHFQLHAILLSALEQVLNDSQQNKLDHILDPNMPSQDEPPQKETRKKEAKSLDQTLLDEIKLTDPRRMMYVLNSLRKGPYRVEEEQLLKIKQIRKEYSKILRSISPWDLESRYELNLVIGSRILAILTPEQRTAIYDHDRKVRNTKTSAD